MKRRLITVCILFCFIFAQIPAQAQVSANAALSDVAVGQGESVEIAVQLSDNPGLAAWVFEVRWDPVNFVLEQDPEVGEAFTSGTLLSNHTEGSLIVSWFAVRNVSEDGVLFRFCLKAIGQAGKYPIAIICSSENTINVKGEEVPVSTLDGAITITGSGNSDNCGEKNDPREPTLPSGNLPEGDSETQPPDDEEYDPQEPTPPSGNLPEGDSETQPPNDEEHEPQEPTPPSGNLPEDGNETQPPDDEDTTPAQGENPFTDVLRGSYYHDPVLWAVEQGITTGTSKTTFSPEMICTRAQMVTFLWRAAGSPESTATDADFTDIFQSGFYFKAVLWAVENGITSGTSATTFSPDEIVTRAQVVTFLWRMAGSPQVGENSPFIDAALGQYYTGAVAWAVENNITGGTSATTFSPMDGCTRGQIVTFLYRYYQ